MTKQRADITRYLEGGEAGLCGKRQARYQWRMSSLLAGR
jgi:hypothetical protein